MPADVAAEWTSKWLRSSKPAAKTKQKKHTGTSSVAKTGFVLAGCWLAAGSDFWRRELPPVVPGIVPSFVFKQTGWHAVNIWLLLAKLSHKTLNTNYQLGQKEYDLFIYYLFTLLWYLETLGQDLIVPDSIQMQNATWFSLCGLISPTKLHGKSYLWCTTLWM